MRYPTIVLVCAFSVSGCSAIKALGEGDPTKALAIAGEAMECEKLRDMVIAAKEEYAIGGAIAVNIVGSNGGLMLPTTNSGPEYDLHVYINTVGRNLGSQSDRPNLPWTFGVLDTDAFNAYSTPGGYVLVSRGLLMEIENEAQLAGVLAHEIAHVTQRHALELYSAIKANQCQTMLATKVGAEEAASALGFKDALKGDGFIDLDDVANLEILTGLANDLVDKITSLGFADDDEFDADARAAALMLTAGYDPTEYQRFIAKIPAEGSTHPANSDRQAKLTEWSQGKAAEEDPFAPSPTDDRLRKIRITTQLQPIK